MYKSSASLKVKWEKLPAKAGQNRRHTASPKPFVAIGQLQCDCVSTKNDRSNKNLISIPDITDLENLLHVDSIEELINHPSSYF